MTIYHRLLAAAAVTTGLSIALAANVNASPADDFWECAGEHPDDIGVCCVFYGGTYDEKTGECWDYPEVAETSPGPSVPPKKPVLTRVPLAPITAVR